MEPFQYIAYQQNSDQSWVLVQDVSTVLAECKADAERLAIADLVKAHPNYDIVKIKILVRPFAGS